ncbi:MAG: hypothetical protein QOD49_643 [Actinomycetota bacterium]|jgi:hypothetical protein|nr:hypothetical protein [Actinomycetota bacterium]
MRHELAFSGGSSRTDSYAAVSPEDEVSWFGRSIVILGPTDRLDLEELARSVWPGTPPLLIVNVGYPQTTEQRAGVRAAMRLATKRGFCFEAQLAWSMDEALDVVSPFDEVLRCLSERVP